MRDARYHVCYDLYSATGKRGKNSKLKREDRTQSSHLGGGSKKKK